MEFMDLDRWMSGKAFQTIPPFFLCFAVLS